MADDRMTDEPGWPLRAVILLAVGAAAALLIQQLIEPDDRSFSYSNMPAWRMAVATGIGVGGLAFGFGLSRVRIVWTIAFAVALGVVAGLIVWWNGQPDGPWSWSGASLFLSVAIALPLFQVARDEGRASFPYTQVHGHAWTNVVLWGACWGFTGIVLLLSHLLAELFALIGIDFIREILRKNWSNSLIIGGAFGAALALLRDRDRVVRLLQRVVTSVLSFLAPILGVALVLFIVSLPFTGLNNLWEATRSTTPTLMACVIGALILANAVIGHGPEDEATNPLLRWSALALGVSVLPLAVIAAIAMGLRLNQYGMTPDRLWGLTVVVFAVGYGLVYLIGLARKRLDWAPLIRRDNIRLAFATMAAGLVLATPLLGFNAISANDQVARLTSGKVTIQKFDWAALAFDFGDPGRKALEALTRSGNASIAMRAREVAKADGRWDVAGTETLEDGANALAKRVRILPRSVPLPGGLLQSFQTSPSDAGTAALWYEPGATSAILVSTNCERCGPQVSLARRDAKNEWQMDRDFVDLGGSRTREENKELADLLAAQGFQVRPVRRRQVYIGDQPVGSPFE